VALVQLLGGCRSCQLELVLIFDFGDQKAWKKKADAVELCHHARRPRMRVLYSRAGDGVVQLGRSFPLDRTLLPVNPGRP
jgi:hypothetical protein